MRKVVFIVLIVAVLLGSATTSVLANKSEPPASQGGNGHGDNGHNQADPNGGGKNDQGSTDGNNGCGNSRLTGDDNNGNGCLKKAPTAVPSPVPPAPNPAPKPGDDPKPSLTTTITNTCVQVAPSDCPNECELRLEQLKLLKTTNRLMPLVEQVLRLLVRYLEKLTA